MCRSKGLFTVQGKTNGLFLFTSGSEMQKCLSGTQIFALWVPQIKHKDIIIKLKSGEEVNCHLSLHLISLSPRNPHVPPCLTCPPLTGSQRISDSEISDYDCEDGVGVITGNKLQTSVRSCSIERTPRRLTRNHPA